MAASRYLKLAIYVAGIYICFLTWAVLQERVSAQLWCVGEGEERKCERYTHIIVLNSIQALTAAAVAFACITLGRPKGQSTVSLPPKNVLVDFAKVALSHTLASPFGYASLRHINYPTHVLAKSCKLVPVMLTGLFLHKRQYMWYQYASVVLVTVGVAWFTLAKDSTGSSERSNSAQGLFLVFINLALDGYTNSAQDELFHKYKLGAFDMMLYLNLAGFAIMQTYLLMPWNTQLVDALAFFHRHPAIIYDIILFCLCGAVGQIFVYGLLQDFGSLVLVTVTVTRKLMTIFVSCLWYGHALNPQQYAAIAAVFLGLSLEGLMKERQKYLQRAASKSK